MESLDTILSGRGEPTPAPDATKSVEETTKAPVVADTQQQPADPPDEVIEHQDGRKMVPLEALTETRGKVKRYTEQVAEFERKFADQSASFDRRFAEVLQAVRQPPQQPQTPQQPAPDFFSDPDAALRAAFTQNLAPLASQLAETRVALLEERLTRLAGPEKMAKIEAEIGKAMNAGDPDIMTLQNELRTKGPAAAQQLVDWYDKRAFDPAAERERIKAEVLAEMQGQEPGLAKVQAAPVMPSNIAGARNVGNRAGPMWSGPPPLQDIFNRKNAPA